MSPLKEAIAKALRNAQSICDRANLKGDAETTIEAGEIVGWLDGSLDASGDTRYVAITREQRDFAQAIIDGLPLPARAYYSPLNAIIAAFDCAGAPDAPSEP